MFRVSTKTGESRKRSLSAIGGQHELPLAELGWYLYNSNEMHSPFSRRMRGNLHGIPNDCHFERSRIPGTCRRSYQKRRAAGKAGARPDTTVTFRFCHKLYDDGTGDG